MIRTIYIEDRVADHPRTLSICARFPDAVRISCHHYGEIFNRRNQNFRLQKQRPALILAQKQGETVLSAPPEYGIGAQHNYYFSHMLNCLYDCRYCFLQGMYRSAHYLVFVNYEDFLQGIFNTHSRHRGETTCFFSGYDCDSLALEPMTGFVEWALPQFAPLAAATLELRTKSTQIRNLLDRAPVANCVVAFSLTPARLAGALEHRTPAPQRRIEAAARLQAAGWAVGLRFDPLLYCDDFAAQYDELFEQTFTQLDGARLHSVTFGPMRMPRGFFKTLVRLYPDEPLFAGPLQRRGGDVSYLPEIEARLLDHCRDALSGVVPKGRLFCQGAAKERLQ